MTHWMHAQSLSCVWLLRIPMDQPARLLSLWEFSGNNIRVGCHLFLRGVFLGLLCLLRWQENPLPLSYLRCPYETLQPQNVTASDYVVHICNDTLHSHQKEGHNVICSNMDGPRDCGTVMSDREGEVSYDIPPMWDLKRNNTNELTYTTERQSQTQKMNLWLLDGRTEGRYSQGICNGHVQYCYI